jgi:hypothetical protein
VTEDLSDQGPAVRAFARAHSNLMRVGYLLNRLPPRRSPAHGEDPGGYSTADLDADLDRAVAVMLHAVVDDLLRSLASVYWLERATPDELATVPLDDRSSTSKFHLGALLSHRGRSVDELLRSSIQRYLDRSSVNGPEDVSEFMKLIGVTPDRFRELFPALGELARRRHQIVHRADLTPEGWLTPLDTVTVVLWLDAVSRFVEMLRETLQVPRPSGSSIAFRPPPRPDGKKQTA